MKNQIINFFKECPMELKPIFIFTGIAIIHLLFFYLYLALFKSILLFIVQGSVLELL